jgi:MoxR-like ATPase
MTDIATASADELLALENLKNAYALIRSELSKVIVGQEQVIEQILIAIFAQGHCLLEGVPGLAKTLMVSTLARSLKLKFSRIQFTPDLMPSDITGTEVIEENRSTGAREFKFLEGPLFANVILADEINRTPPKTQAALLESMQERKASIGGTDWRAFIIACHERGAKSFPYLGANGPLNLFARVVLSST